MSNVFKIKMNKRRMMMGMSSLKDGKKKFSHEYFIVSKDSREYKAKTTLKLNKLKNLIQGTQTEQTNSWDSDDDLAEYPLVIGEKVDL